METIEAIRRIKAELPGASTILGLSNVSFGLKPVARHVLNSVFLHECREAGLDAAIVARGPDRSAQPRRRAPARGRPRSDLRPPPRRLRPAHRVHGTLRGRRGRRHRKGRPFGLAGVRALVAPDHRRRSRRPRSRPRRGTRLAVGARDRQRRAARRDEGRGRAVRLGRDAVAVRPAVGRDHEDRGRLPRAPHGEGRRGRKGHSRAGHGQGRRARHRQEPRRHHPDQQRVHGLQPRDQGRDHRDDRQGPRGRRGRDRHERPPREVDHHHAREPRGAEHARSRRSGPGAARRRGAHAQLRGARPPRRLRGPCLLRKGRVRGAAHHGDAHGGQALGRARSRVRSRGGRTPAPAAQE